MSALKELGWKQFKIAQELEFGPPVDQPPRLTNFTMDDQEKSLWCWAAAALSAARSLNKVKFNSQCALVRVSIDGCGGNCKDDSLCNKRGSIRNALKVRHQIDISPSESLPSALVVKTVLTDQRPILCRVSWHADEERHVVAISEFQVSAGKNYVVVKDPEKPPRTKAWQKRWALVDFASYVRSVCIPT